MIKSQAFTLAEVLITLVIIGVIAAMTIPTLMGSTNNQEIKTAFKKAVSAANQAVTLDYALYGTTLSNEEGNELLTRVLKNHMSVIEECYEGDCHNFKTADGMIYFVEQGCYFRVDVNGEKGNREAEVDIFGVDFAACSRSAVPSTDEGRALLYE